MLSNGIDTTIKRPVIMERPQPAPAGSFRLCIDLDPQRRPTYRTYTAPTEPPRRDLTSYYRGEPSQYGRYR